jgi:hypothetical protein
MRASMLVGAVLVALLLPKNSNAQAYAYGTPPPDVTAATAAWQSADAPIIVNGLVFLPTRGFRFFDAGVMTQSGVYEGVPVYADVTIEPYSIVYVPVSRTTMRVYERRRDGALAGTTGSRTPSFPVAIASDTVLANTRREEAAAALSAANAAASPVATTGTVVGAPAAAADTIVLDRPRPSRTRVEFVPSSRPSGPNGVWLVYNGARWYADGTAVPFSPDRFEPIGDYRGFLVYRAKDRARDREKEREKDSDGNNEIWVSVVKDGPVAPYSRR